MTPDRQHELQQRIDKRFDEFSLEEFRDANSGALTFGLAFPSLAGSERAFAEQYFCRKIVELRRSAKGEVRDTCPLCGRSAEITDVVSYDVDCPECKKFRITERASAFVKQNPAQVKDQLPLASRAVRDAEVPLVITYEEDIAAIAAKQQADERGEKKE